MLNTLHETEKTIHLDPMLNTEQFKCLKTAAGQSTNVFSLNFQLSLLYNFFSEKAYLLILKRLHLETSDNFISDMFKWDFKLL